ncbi:hypothetical protein INT46_005143, partial [Mucor plumbeus]
MKSKQFTTWSDFKVEITNKYGRNQPDVKEEARKKLERIHYKKTESFDDFIEELQELKVVAEIRDEGYLVRYLFKALPEELVKDTKFYFNFNIDKQGRNIDFIIPKVVGTYEALFKEKWDKYLIVTTPRIVAIPVSMTAVFIATFIRKSFFEKKKHGFNNNKNSSLKGKSQLRCKYRPGLINHAEESCILAPDVKKHIKKAQKQYGMNVKICNRCKVPNYTFGHQCKEEDLEKVFKNKQKKAIVPVDVEADNQDMDTDEESEFKIHFAALSIKDKKD